MPILAPWFQVCNRAVTRAQPRIAAALLLATALALSFSAAAQSPPRPEALIKWRQSAYQVIAWNSGRIKVALNGSWNAHEVRGAAETLAAVASSGLPALFAHGTAQGKGWRETSASEAVWSDAEKFRALNDDFVRETRELARVAAGGEQKVVNAQFLKVAGLCKSCHDRFRQTD